MLDVKRTWDDLVTRHAPDPARRERILRNRLYQQMSSALAGSQEYMAMEKLYEFATDRDYDLIVLDTPPTAHALDFLDAPDRILDFLGNDTARAILAPALGAGRLGLRLAQLGGGYIAKTLARFTGQAGARGPRRLPPGLPGHVRRVQGAGRGGALAARAPRRRLRARDVPLPRVDRRGARVPRAAPRRGDAGGGARREPRDAGPLGRRRPAPRAEQLGAPLAAAGVRDGRFASRLATTLAEHQALAVAERQALERLLARVSAPRAVVPRLATDVHDLAGLASLADRL